MWKIVGPCLLLAVVLGIRKVSGADDPCDEATNLYVPGQNRSSTRANTPIDILICDDGISKGKWFRFDRNGTNNFGSSIPTTCIASNFCSTEFPIWMSGTLPSSSSPGPIDAWVCAGEGSDSCCGWTEKIEVKWCPPGYYVYKLKPADFCNSAYCFDENSIVPSYPELLPELLEIEDPYISDYVETYTYIGGGGNDTNDTVPVNATVFSIGCTVNFSTIELPNTSANGPFVIEINLVVQDDVMIPLLAQPFYHTDVDEHMYVFGEELVRDYLNKPIMCSARAYWDRTPTIKSPVIYSRAITLEFKLKINPPEFLSSKYSAIVLPEAARLKFWLEANFPITTRHCYLSPEEPCFPYEFIVNMPDKEMQFDGCLLIIPFGDQISNKITVAPIKTVGRRAWPFTVNITFDQLNDTKCQCQESIIYGFTISLPPIIINENGTKPTCTSVTDPHVKPFFSDVNYHLMDHPGCFTFLKSKCPGWSCRDFEIQVIHRPLPSQPGITWNCGIAVREGNYLIKIYGCATPTGVQVTEYPLSGGFNPLLKPKLTVITSVHWKISLQLGIVVDITYYQGTKGYLDIEVIGLPLEEYEGLCAPIGTNYNIYRCGECNLFYTNYNLTKCGNPSGEDDVIFVPNCNISVARSIDKSPITLRPKGNCDCDNLSAAEMLAQGFVVIDDSLMQPYVEFEGQGGVVLNDLWPTPINNITESDAVDACRQEMEGLAIFDQCVDHVGFQDLLDTCVIDIKVTDDLGAVTSYSEAFISQCKHAVESTVVRKGDTDEDPEGSDLLNSINAQTCPGQCRLDGVVRGSCENGSCICYTGYKGVACTVEIDRPPQLVEVLGGSIDTTNLKINDTFVVIVSAGNIDPEGEIDCRVSPSENSGIPPIHFVPPARVMAGGLVACLFQVDGELGDQYSTSLSVSNDGRNFSDPADVSIYDDICTWNLYDNFHSLLAVRIDGVDTLEKCTRLCCSDDTCVGLDFDTKSKPPACFFHRNVITMHSNRTEKNGVKQLVKLTCRACSQPKWTTYRGAQSSGGILYKDYTILDTCKSYCLCTDNCLGVDFNYDKRECRIHTDEDKLKDIDDKQEIDQHLLTCCKSRSCPVKWIVLQGTNSRGATHYKRFKTVESCRAYCETLSDCVALDIEPDSSTSIKCYIYKDRQQLEESRRESDDVNQHVLLRCACSNSWTKYENQHSLLGQQIEDANTEAECKDACEARSSCIAADFSRVSNPGVCRIHVGSDSPDRSPSEGVDQFVISRSTDCSANEVTWSVYPGIQSSGAKHEKDFVTLQDCQKFCIGLPECYGLDWRKNKNPPECWIYTDATKLRDRKGNSDTDQYVIERVFC